MEYIIPRNIQLIDTTYSSKIVAYIIAKNESSDLKMAENVYRMDYNRFTDTGY